MPQLSDVVLTVASTLTVQGAYFVFFSYPSEVSAKRLELESRQELMSAQMNDEGDWQQVIPESLNQIGALSNGLFNGMTPEVVAATMASLKLCRAQLRGLEVFDQPLASHIGKMSEIVDQAIDIATGWDGRPQPEVASDFGLVMKTVLYSAKAVKRAHDRSLTNFWMDMRRDAWELKPLVSRFMASAICLEIICIALLSYGFRTLAQHGMAMWVATTGWIVVTAMVSFVIYKVMIVVRPLNALIRSIEESSASRLQDYSALASLAATMSAQGKPSETKAQNESA